MINYRPCPHLNKKGKEAAKLPVIKVDLYRSNPNQTKEILKCLMSFFNPQSQFSLNLHYVVNHS